MQDNKTNNTQPNSTPAVNNNRPVSSPRFAGRGGQRPPRRGGHRDDKRFTKPEFDSKILSIRRVARVVSGGRRFSFSVYIAVGDRKGSVGVGTGKAGDTALAIDKATKAAKKNMIKVPLTETMSIPCESEAKYCSASVNIRPAAGRGLVAGSSARTILSLAGVKDVNVKIRSRSKNKINNARATVEALRKLKKLCNSTK